MEVALRPRLRITREQREEAKQYIKMQLPAYLEREGINPMHNFRCLNPDHNDDYGDMSYHRKTNTCVCHCGAHYDTLDLIAVEYGLKTYNETFQKACEIFGLFGQSEDENSVKIPENWRENIPDYKVSERASDEFCSAFYYALTKSDKTKLRPEHESDLLKRGLTKEDIKRFRFSSTPLRGENRHAAQDVIEQVGLFPKNVPGFYINGRSWSLKNDTSGYYCPVFDGEKNEIRGFQIRADVPTKKGKYVWVSTPKEECGASSGAMPTILPGKNQKIWIVTEGILKALIVYCLLDRKISVIGVPGVGTLGGFNQFMKEHEGSDILFVEAYDMDKTLENKEVKIAWNKLLKNIKDAGFKCHSLKWDMDDNGKWNEKFKGLDDFLCDYKKTGDINKFISYLNKLYKKCYC